jgi:two-component system nitrogen regulation response regulator NtrX
LSSRTILIIDDEEGIRTVLGDVLADEGFSILRAADGQEGLRLIKTEVIDMIFLDVWMPGMGGLDVLRAIKEEVPEVPVVMVSGHASIDVAVKAVKHGAWDFVEKPLSMDKTLSVVANALKVQDLRRENRELKAQLFLEDTMIGECAAMLRVKELIRQSASVNARVMILGENGTGKELVAREIHRQSARSRRPFVEVNCAAIPDTLIESELFGHEKGAFTNAIARRKGRFEQADTGTLFLDEVADMSLSAQAKVLRAVQESRFERIGGEGSVTVDVRLISATNKDVPAEVAAGRFREDLYYRLNVVPISVPPLRDRREDLPLLADYFLRKFSTDPQRAVPVLSPEALAVLADHPWPGNIRELKNCIERISLMVDEPVIGPDEARAFLGAAPAELASPLAPWAGLGLNEAKDAFEKAFIEEKLKENGYNISRTAQALGLYASNLHTKLKKFAIEVGR